MEDNPNVKKWRLIMPGMTEEMQCQREMIAVILENQSKRLEELKKYPARSSTMKLTEENQDAIDLNNEIEFRKNAPIPKQGPLVSESILHEHNLTRWLTELWNLRAEVAAMKEANKCTDRYGDHLRKENEALKLVLRKKGFADDAELWNARIQVGLGVDLATTDANVIRSQRKEIARLNELLESTNAQCENYRKELINNQSRMREQKATKEVWSIPLDLDDEFCEFMDESPCPWVATSTDVGADFSTCTLHKGQQPMLRPRRMRVHRSWGNEVIFRRERLDICKNCRIKIVGEKP